MSSSQNKTCAICLGSVETGQGQAIFTAECSHSFHFGCIGNNVRHGNYLCPVCRAAWKDLPFVIPNFNANANDNSMDHDSFHTDAIDNSMDHGSFLIRPNLPLQVPPLQVPGHASVVEPEPLQFSDDEPLPDVTADSTSTAAGLRRVSIKAIPERPAVADSDFIPHFAVLVGLTAPCLSEDARHAQRAPVDLVMILDVSSSMRGSKLILLKRAVNFVIDNLGPLDRLSVVSFATNARRVFPLCRMTENGRDHAKGAINSLFAYGSTDIVKGLKKGVQVLEDRHHRNPVASIMFLSDGRDTCNNSSQFLAFQSPRELPEYLQLLPPSICPSNRETEDRWEFQTFPVHAFGFGSDHDPLTMHSISDSSGGTFSFIESYAMVQDAFASCIGGLLSVVTQELCLMMRSASHGVEIKSILSGRYASEISDQGSQGTINVGDLYADEEKEFLINLSVPILRNAEGLESERKMSILDITCSYRDVVSKEMVQIEGDLVEIRRPEALSPQDTTVNLEVDRQRNRLNAAESIAEAQHMAEMGNLSEARTILSSRRSTLLSSASGQVSDGLCMWLEAEMREIEERMGSVQLYERHGRAYTLSNMSSHGYQRATTRGTRAESTSSPSIGPSDPTSPGFSGYLTPEMSRMVRKSQQLSITEDENSWQE